MFICHADAGWRGAVIYSLLISARRRGHDPAAYLSDILRRVPSIKATDLDTLLPENWKPLTPRSLLHVQTSGPIQPRFLHTVFLWGSAYAYARRLATPTAFTLSIPDKYLGVILRFGP